MFSTIATMWSTLVMNVMGYTGITSTFFGTALTAIIVVVSILVLAKLIKVTYNFIKNMVKETKEVTVPKGKAARAVTVES
jgi:hypothetical protein